MRRGAAAACLALALLATGGDCSVRLAKPRLSRVARVRVLGAAPPIDESRVAVVLNANARRVGAREIALARELVGAEHVFATRCDEEAKAAYTQIVARGYGTVVPAGGDGTLCAVINGLANERRDAWGEVLPLVGMPRFAYLPLGTGNGMATLVGPRQNMAEALRLLLAGCKLGGGVGGAGPGLRTLPVPLIEVDGGDLCFFAGCGFDSLMLDDFRVIRSWALANIPIKWLASALGSLLGYVVAYFVRTLPQCMLGRHRVWARVTAPARPRNGQPLADLAGLAYERRTDGSHSAEASLSTSEIQPQPSVTNGQSQPSVPNGHSQSLGGSAAADAAVPFGTWFIDPRRGDCPTRVDVLQGCAGGLIGEEPALAGEAGSESGSWSVELRGAEGVPADSAQEDFSGEQRLVLFEGDAGIIAAGTSPYYGGGLKLFPFARVRPMGMHLRIGRIHPFLGFVKLWWIFRGTYRNYNSQVLDYVGSDFTVELSSEYPFQHSGEAVGKKSKFTLKVAHAPVRFVNFLPAPSVRDAWTPFAKNRALFQSGAKTGPLAGFGAHAGAGEAMPAVPAESGFAPATA